MKTLLLLLACFICTVSIAQTFYKHGKGTGRNYQCGCYDDNGRLYAGHTTADNDSFIFDRWDPATNLWTEGVRSVNTWEEWDQGFTNDYICESLRDTIYLGVYRKQSSEFKRVYRVTDNDGKLIARMQDSTGKHFEFRLMKLKGRIFLVGDQEKINGVQTGKLAYFMNETWISANDPLPTKNISPVILSYAGRNDTAFFTVEEKFNIVVYRWVFPNQWTKMQLNRHVEKVFSIGNSWVFAKGNNTDSLFYLVNGNLVGRKISREIDAQKCVETNKGVIFYNEFSLYYSIGNPPPPPKKEYLLFFNTTSGEVTPFYQYSAGKKVNLIVSDTQCSIFSELPVKYGYVNYRNLAGIRPDSIRGYGFDTIGIKVFWDKDKNGVYGTSDQYPDKLEVRNTIFGNILKSTPGAYLEEIIPDYIGAEYQLVTYAFNSCVFKAYSGNIRASNLDPGVSNQLLEFPLQSSDVQDLAVTGISRRQARLNDSLVVTFNVFNSDCSYTGNVACSLFVVLHPGTTLLSSSPAYSVRKGDTVFFNSLSIKGRVANPVKLSLRYASQAFKPGETVRHNAFIKGVSETNMENNSDSVVQLLIYSYDPNAKHSTPSGEVMYSPDLLRYHIQFQNEGNDEARTVIVTDTLDARYDPHTFRMLEASHAYSVAHKDNVVIWTFENIKLSPKSSDEESSRGYIVFDIKLKKPLEINESISNRTSIFFDDNSPVITQEAMVKRIKFIPPKPPLVLDAMFDDSVSCRSVKFNNKTKGDVQGFLWDFGDGKVSSLKEPVNIYQRNGNYPVSLVTWGFDSSIAGTVYDTITKTIVIQCTICDSLEKFTYLKDRDDCRKVYFHNTVDADSMGFRWYFRHKNTNYNYYVSDPVMVFPDTGHFKVMQAVTYYSKSYYNTCMDTLTGYIDIVCNPVSGLRDIVVDHGFVCSPNPAQDYLRIDNLHGDSQVIHIYDMRGMEIGSMDIEGLATVHISTAAWAAGIYIVSGSSGEVTRLLVER